MGRTLGAPVAEKAVREIRRDRVAREQLLPLGLLTLLYFVTTGDDFKSRNHSS